MEPSLQPLARMQQQLAAQWQAFCARPEMRLCRWLAAAADLPLLRQCLQALADEGEAAVWVAPPGQWPVLPPPAAPPLVAWLTELPPDAEHQLRQALTGGGTSRFLVLEDAQQQPLHRLARWYPALVHTATPPVSLARLLRELHEQTTPETPAEHWQQQFQRQFQRLNEALAAGQPNVEPLAAACHRTCAAARQQLAAPPAEPELAVAHQGQVLSWTSADIGVELMLGPHYLAQRQPELALAHYQAALAQSEAAHATGVPGLGLLSVHAWLGQAAAWQQRRRPDAALAALHLALARAQALDAPTLAAEAARQLGVVLDRAGEHRAASAAYCQALDLTESLPPGQRSPALVQEAGAACLRRLHTAAERKALRTRLQLLLY